METRGDCRQQPFRHVNDGGGKADLLYKADMLFLGIGESWKDTGRSEKQNEAWYTAGVNS